MRLRLRRGLVDAGLVATVALLVAGVLLGTGFAQTELATPDPLTWLWNTRGELTRVNPETGSPTDRLPGVALPGDPMTLVQDGDTLIVTNLRTFEVTTVDVPMLRIAGTRPGRAGGVRVLLTRGEVYLANLMAGTVERMDPLSAATVGAAWQAGRPLVDVAADQQGGVFALDQGGTLTGLRWAPGRATLVPDLPHQVSGVDPDAALVAHATGVTVFTSGGVVEQVGTGDDRAVQVGELTPPLVPASVSPANLVPISTPETSEVHLLRNGSAVTVDTGGLDCASPGRSAVFEGEVYVPCLGDGKVLVLDEEGRPAAPELVTVPGGSPEVLVNAGLLFVNEPGDSRGLVVRKDGSVRAIDTHGSTVPVLDQAGRPTALPSPTIVPSAPPTIPTGTGTPTGGGSPPTSAPATRTPTNTPTQTQTRTLGPTSQSPPPSTVNPATYTPTNVQAQARDRSALITWTAAPVSPSRYEILSADTNAIVSTAEAGATSAIAPNLQAGLKLRFVVVAIVPGVGVGRFPSVPSPEVQIYGPAGAPGVDLQVLGRGPQMLEVLVTVTPVDDGGDPAGLQSFDVTVTSNNTGAIMASQTGIPAANLQYRATVPCGGVTDVCLSGGNVTATATVNNAAGAGPPGSGSAGVPPPPLWNYRENGGAPVLWATVDGRCIDVGFVVQTCDINDIGQQWFFSNLGWIGNQARGTTVCLHNNGTFVGSGCRDDTKRWTRIGLAAGGDGGPISNFGTLRGDFSDQCISHNGFTANVTSPCGEFGPFGDHQRLILFPVAGGLPWAG